MKYSTAALLLLGAISVSEAHKLQQSSSADVAIDGAEYLDKLTEAQQKAKDAAVQAEKSKKKVEELKAKHGAEIKKLQKVDPVSHAENKPEANSKVQVQSSMDVKTPGGLVVQVEAVKKP